VKLHEFVVRRLLLLVPVLIGVAILTFTISHLIPADAAAARCGDRCGLTVAWTEDGEPISAYQQNREQMGMNEPVTTQFRIYFEDLAVGDWGESSTYHRPVVDVLRDAAPITL